MSDTNGTDATRTPGVDRLRAQYVRECSALALDVLKDIRLFEATLDISQPAYNATQYRWDIADETNENYPGLAPSIPPIGVPSYKRGDALPVYRDEVGLATIRNRSRVLCHFNEFAIGALRNRANYVIGDGLKYTAKPAKQTRECKRLAARVQEFIDLFSEVNDLPSLEAETLMAADEDGERFLRHFPSDNGMTELRAVQPEHVTAAGAPVDAGSATYTYGVECPPDDIEGRRAYWIVDNPSAPSGWTPVRVNAKYVSHLRVNVKRDAKRGIPTFFPAEANLKRCEGLQAAMGYLAKLRAKIGLVYTLPSATGNSVAALRNSLNTTVVNNPATGQQLTAENLPWASILRLTGDQKLDMPSINSGVAELVEVLQADLRSVASMLNMPEWMFTAVASATYSNAFVAEGPTLKAMKKLQADLCRFFCGAKYSHRRGVVWKAVVYAARRGVFGCDVDEVLESVDILAKGPSLETRDKASEANTNKTYNEMGVKSKRTIRDELSLDDETEALNLAAEQADTRTQKLRDNLTGLLQVQQAYYAGQVSREAAGAALVSIGYAVEDADRLLPLAGAVDRTSQGQQQAAGPGGDPDSPPGMGAPTSGPDGGSGSPPDAPPPDGTPNPNPIDALLQPSRVQEQTHGSILKAVRHREQIKMLRESCAFVLREGQRLTRRMEMRLLEAGFTGTVKDPIGRVFYYQDGRRVKNPYGKGSDPTAPKHESHVTRATAHEYHARAKRALETLLADPSKYDPAMSAELPKLIATMHKDLIGAYAVRLGASISSKLGKQDLIDKVAALFPTPAAPDSVLSSARQDAKVEGAEPAPSGAGGDNVTTATIDRKPYVGQKVKRTVMGPFGMPKVITGTVKQSRNGSFHIVTDPSSDGGVPGVGGLQMGAHKTTLDGWTDAGVFDESRKAQAAIEAKAKADDETRAANTQNALTSSREKAIAAGSKPLNPATVKTGDVVEDHAGGGRRLIVSDVMQSRRGPIIAAHPEGIDPDEHPEQVGTLGNSDLYTVAPAPRTNDPEPTSLTASPASQVSSQPVDTTAAPTAPTTPQPWTPPVGSKYADVPKAGNNTSVHDTDYARRLVDRLNTYEREWIQREAKDPTRKESLLHHDALMASGLTGDGLTTARGYAGKKPSSKPGVFFPAARTPDTAARTPDTAGASSGHSPADSVAIPASHAHPAVSGPVSFPAADAPSQVQTVGGRPVHAWTAGDGTKFVDVRKPDYPERRGSGYMQRPGGGWEPVPTNTRDTGDPDAETALRWNSTPPELREKLAADGMLSRPKAAAPAAPALKPAKLNDLPPGVASAVRGALSALRTHQDDRRKAVEPTEVVSGAGKGTFDESAASAADARHADAVTKARATLDEFRRLATTNGIDPESVISDAGGIPEDAVAVLKRKNADATAKPAAPLSAATPAATPAVPTSHPALTAILDHPRGVTEGVFALDPAKRFELAAHLDRTTDPGILDDAKAGGNIIPRLVAAANAYAGTHAANKQQARTDAANKTKAEADARHTEYVNELHGKLTAARPEWKAEAARVMASGTKTAKKRLQNQVMVALNTNNEHAINDALTKLVSAAPAAPPPVESPATISPKFQ